MSWDRVIQDSDEDEPLVEDGIPPSIDSPQGEEFLIQPDHDTPADHQTRFIAEHTMTQNTSTEPQLGVNFDQFLQSQEGQLAPPTLSQQRREERWIPSTSEGGGGSIGAGAGAMMTEIGLAQQRLLDDDTSSASRRLPSTTTPYSSEISHPGSFPAMPTYQYQQEGVTTNEDFNSAKPAHEAPYEATQLVAPVQSHVYDYSTPAASTHVDYPTAVSELPATNPTSLQQTEGARGYMAQKTPQRSKSMQSVPYSPHDTEPLSSVVSPRLSRAKSDNARLEPMSPHSPADTHDELSLPAVAVEISTVKKKRGRPKKQSIPEDDEDDELAVPQKAGSARVKDEEKQPRDPSNTTTNISVVTDDNVAASKGDANTSGARENPSSKESKKEKVKRSRTADAVMQKAQALASDDDLIWVDSRPIQAENLKQQNGKNSTLLENDTYAPPQPEPTEPNTENHTDREEKPAPKKRGRKRKQTTEQQLTTESDPQTSKENQPPKEPEPNPSTTLLDREQPPSTTTTTIEEPTKSTSTSTPTTTPDPTTLPPPKPATEEQHPPQTPQRTDVSNQDPNTRTTKKGPGQHSPISSTGKVPYRVGLSKRARIAPLLKVVRK